MQKGGCGFFLRMRTSSELATITVNAMEIDPTEMLAVWFIGQHEAVPGSQIRTGLLFDAPQGRLRLLDSNERGNDSDE